MEKIFLLIIIKGGMINNSGPSWHRGVSESVISILFAQSAALSLNMQCLQNAKNGERSIILGSYDSSVYATMSAIKREPPLIKVLGGYQIFNVLSSS